MKFSIVFLLATLFSIISYGQENPEIISPQKPDLQHFSIEQLFMTKQHSGCSWSPDDKQIAFVSNFTGRYNIYLISSGGGWPTQLTVSDERQFDPVWSPDGKWIAFVSDYGGNEMWDLFLVSPVNGEVINLTNSPEIAEEHPVWSPDGKWIAYTVKPRTSSVNEIFVMNIESRETRQLTTHTAANLTNSPVCFSHNGASIIYNQSRSDDKDANILLVTIATHTSTLLTPHEDEAKYYASDISYDGTSLLITSDTHPDYKGFLNAGIMDIPANTIEWLSEEGWESYAGNFSPSGLSVTWTTNVEGNTEVFMRDLVLKRDMKLPIKRGVVSLAGNPTSFSHSAKRIALYINGPTSPNNLWSYDVSSLSALQVTFAFTGGVQGKDMVEPYLVHYETFDGRKISALLYVPYNLQPDHSSPAIIYMHGGPTSQVENIFNRSVQYFVNNGYVVLAPNYRGSSGYGKEFEELNHFDMGGGDLKDCIAGTKFLATLPFVDPKKFIAYGGSYGGYLTMMAVTKYPEVWAAGVPIVPFVNWFTEVANEDPALQQWDIATMGDSVKRHELWKDRSPIFFIGNVKAPLLLFAGENDPRCPKSETQQVVDEIQKRKGVVEYKIYEHEGHGFAKLENQIDAFKRTVSFLDKYVKGK